MTSGALRTSCANTTVTCRPSTVVLSILYCASAASRSSENSINPNPRGCLRSRPPAATVRCVSACVCCIGSASQEAEPPSRPCVGLALRALALRALALSFLPSQAVTRLVLAKNLLSSSSSCLGPWPWTLGFGSVGRRLLRGRGGQGTTAVLHLLPEERGSLESRLGLTCESSGTTNARALVTRAALACFFAAPIGWGRPTAAHGAQLLCEIAAGWVRPLSVRQALAHPTPSRLFSGGEPTHPLK